MEAIREQASVSKPTLYNHYQSKDVLFADVVGETMKKIAGEWILAVEADAVPLNTQAELKATLAAFVHQALTDLMRPEYLALLRLAVAEIQHFPQLGTIFQATGPNRGLQTLATILRNAQARGLINVPDTDIAARLFMGSVLSYVMLDGLLTNEPQVPPLERIEVSIEFCMRAINL